MLSCMTAFTQEDVFRKTKNLLRIHGYGDVEIYFQAMPHHAGFTDFHRVTGDPLAIVFSSLHIRAQEANFLNVIKHECAHVLAGFDADHGPRWKRQVERIGGVPNETWPWADLVRPEVIYDWLYVCQACSRTIGAKIGTPPDLTHLVTQCCAAPVRLVDLYISH